ncbi:hypothetical protein CRU99_00780 [Malaciobacter mytili]|uniref:hypothetical protein n=1 Tax=Malaciobacter mytili TaxID=603050 RepID=UPI00100BA41C|nr:hypothetical protein [Malaciobacter mytili]RXI48757.1 hypothetical protein CRU99_00780 [Malaciobacter mytili]
MQDNQKEELKKILQKSMSQEEIHEKLVEQKLKIEEKKQEKTKQKKIFYILFTLVIMFLVVAITYYFVLNSQKIKNYEEKVQIINNPKKIEIQKEPKVEEKIIVKEVIVEKQIPITKEKFKEIFLSKNFNLAKCYDYKVFQIKPDNSCKDNLKEFLLNNTQALRFEIIAVINNEDIKKATVLSNDKTLQEYILRGMARDRVLEVSWYTKEVLGNEILLTPVNYYLSSKKQNKGVMIKAYY